MSCMGVIPIFYKVFDNIGKKFLLVQIWHARFVCFLFWVKWVKTVHRLELSLWKRSQNGIFPIFLFIAANWSHLKALGQLLTGHCILRLNVNRIGLAKQAKCRLCMEDEVTEHLLVTRKIAKLDLEREL